MKKADDILRIKKLNELIELEGSIANLCRNRISGKADKPVDPSHISQIRTGKRTFGEKAARNMEERLGLPHMYFDTEDMSPNTETFTTDNEIKKILHKAVARIADKDLTLEMADLLVEALHTSKENISKSKAVMFALNHSEPEYQATRITERKINGD